MDKWCGKVAIVTGASAGIGAAVCRDLCMNRVIVVGLARRLDRLEELKRDITNSVQGAQFHPLKCDLTCEADIEAAFSYTLQHLGGVDILINNAGIFKQMSTLDGSLDQMKAVIDTNLVAVVSCIQKAYRSMVDRDVPGYIVNVSSVAGHYVPRLDNLPPTFNVYPCTKHALTALVDVLRQELNFMGRHKVRVSNISPGFVKTEIFQAAGASIDMQNVPWPGLESEDVSESIIYLLSTAARVQIQDLIIRPAGETF